MDKGGERGDTKEREAPGGQNRGDSARDSAADRQAQTEMERETEGDAAQGDGGHPQKTGNWVGERQRKGTCRQQRTERWTTDRETATKTEETKTRGNREGDRWRDTNREQNG